jgi:hypothetical protein
MSRLWMKHGIQGSWPSVGAAETAAACGCAQRLATARTCTRNAHDGAAFWRRPFPDDNIDGHDGDEKEQEQEKEKDKEQK